MRVGKRASRVEKQQTDFEESRKPSNRFLLRVHVKMTL